MGIEIRIPLGPQTGGSTQFTMLTMCSGFTLADTSHGCA